MKFFDRLMGKQNGDEMSIREAISVAATDFGNARHEADKKTIDYRMKIAADKDHIRQDAATEEDDEKRKKGLQAVYALNLCMVSLSQIVDYADINVLKQEYDSILNNLNLEVMPKDEALLTAIKQILDTCHFYILHQKDKELLAKKQELRLSNALGKAVSGGVFAIFSTPNPWAIAVSAATMVGVAAVRYKTERRKAMLENEIEAWELEKTALEQLHNLRRTLFETAWRLSKEYGFADNLRLTEAQIKNYNEILTDPDPQSRFERLSLIKNNFGAYPLFWYYLGRAAMEAAELFLPSDERQRNLGCGNDVNVDVVGAFLNVETRALVNDPKSHDEAMSFYQLYRGEAKVAFNKFKHFDDDSDTGVKLKNLLREDVVSASAWLDASDFCESSKEELQHVERAYALAGTNVELLQACAFRYLKLYHNAIDTDSLSQDGAKLCVVHAEDCLRKLISADVRADLNGRALGMLYRSASDHFGESFSIDINEAEVFEPRKRYSRMKVALQSKHAFVPMWLRPWDERELGIEWGKYLKGDGLKRSIACFLDGRMRILLDKFYSALEMDLSDGGWKGLASLKDDWGEEGEAATVGFAKDKKSGLNVSNDCFKDVHMRFWYDAEEYRNTFLSKLYKEELQKIIRSPIEAATCTALGTTVYGMYHAYRVCKYANGQVRADKKRKAEIKVSLDDVVNYIVGTAFQKFIACADCAKSAHEREAELYNRIANFVYKSESGLIWKDNPEIPVSQCADEIKAIEDALRQFVIAVTEPVASFVVRELEFATATDNVGLTDPVDSLQSTRDVAAAYLCNNPMPKNAPMPMCVAFVRSVEEKVSEMQRLIAKKHISGKFNYPPYWSAIESIKILKQ